MSYALHDPTFNGTTDEASETQPSFEDHDSDDLEVIGNSYLLSDSGFPPENFTDLRLRVVDTENHLSRELLGSAKTGLEQLDDIDDQKKEDTRNKINNLAEENFEDADFE